MKIRGGGGGGGGGSASIKKICLGLPVCGTSNTWSISHESKVLPVRVSPCMLNIEGVEKYTVLRLAATKNLPTRAGTTQLKVWPLLIDMVASAFFPSCVIFEVQ